ncbi:MAG: uroporphyrinogen-III synthase [Bacteroidetes bacterium]|nr:uroporphyrinogen-III synthase [Bacteroidota bacterium]
MAKVKSILVSQPPPERENDPYLELAKKHNIKIFFRKLFKIEGVPSKDFRQDRVNLMEYSAIIFTSKNSIDHYFRICGEMRVVVPDSMKYFCVSESVALYLQKYVLYRKRKIFHSKQHFSELVEIMKKHKNENYLLPSSDILKPEIPKLLGENKFNYKRIIFYNTLPNDLSDIDINQFDLIVFFSPAGIKSLYHNFPDFKQNKTLVAAFGNTTANAAKEAGLVVSIQSPNPKAPSMAAAIEQFLVSASKGK